MEMSDFIDKLKEVFEDTDPALLKPECVYKNLDEWCSLIALSVIAMINEEYDVSVKGGDIQSTNTIEDLFNLVILLIWNKQVKNINFAT